MAHSCFVVEHEGFRVLFDPYDPVIGYPAPKVSQVDLIVVSHDHRDHNAVSSVPGKSQVVRGVARRNYGPVVVDGEVGWHSHEEESDPVALTLLEWAGRRLAHFGDLGCPLDSSQMERFKDLDLLLLPVGGGYTINGQAAAGLVKALRPRVAVPMHFQTPFLERSQFPGFSNAEPFLQACREFATVETRREGWLTVPEPSNDSSTTVVYLQHQMA